jgi:hypothetical protein
LHYEEGYRGEAGVGQEFFINKNTGYLSIIAHNIKRIVENNHLQVWLRIEGCEGASFICRVGIYLGKYSMELPEQYKLSSLLVSCLYLHAGVQASVTPYNGLVWQVIIIEDI